VGRIVGLTSIATKDFAWIYRTVPRAMEQLLQMINVTVEMFYVELDNIVSRLVRVYLSVLTLKFVKKMMEVRCQQPRVMDVHASSTEENTDATVVPSAIPMVVV